MAIALFEELKSAIIEMNQDGTEPITRKCLEAGHSAMDILNGALLPALDHVGVLFRDGEYFLPDVLMSVKSYDIAFKMIHKGLLEGNYKSRGKVMLGTVEGDIHEIGKNILSALLQGNGFEVLDLGVDVKVNTFLAKARELSPDIIGMSSLLTTTMPAMKEVIELIKREGLRDKFRIIIGGAPVSQRYADEIGADGYGEDAQSGVELVKRLMA